MARKRCYPFDVKESNGKKIIADIKGRSGPVKVSEVDEDIVLDAEALAVGPKDN